MDVETVAKAVPWFTGIIGTAFGFGLTRWWERRLRRQIRITTKTVNYTLAGSPTLPGELSVTYNGQQYGQLIYFEVEITNISREETLTEVPLLLQFSSPLASIVDTTSSSKPLPIKWTTHPGEGEGQHWATCGALQPNDTATLGLLVADSGQPRFMYRGDHKVAVIDGDLREDPLPLRIFGYGWAGLFPFALVTVISAALHVPTTLAIGLGAVAFSGATYAQVRQDRAYAKSRSRQLHGR